MRAGHSSSTPGATHDRLVLWGTPQAQNSCTGAHSAIVVLPASASPHAFSGGLRGPRPFVVGPRKPPQAIESRDGIVFGVIDRPVRRERSGRGPSPIQERPGLDKTSSSFFVETHEGACRAEGPGFPSTSLFIRSRGLQPTDRSSATGSLSRKNLLLGPLRTLGKESTDPPELAHVVFIYCLGMNAFFQPLANFSNAVFSDGLHIVRIRRPFSRPKQSSSVFKGETLFMTERCKLSAPFSHPIAFHNTIGMGGLKFFSRGRCGKMFVSRDRFGQSEGKTMRQGRGSGRTSGQSPSATYRSHSLPSGIRAGFARFERERPWKWPVAPLKLVIPTILSGGAWRLNPTSTIIRS